MELLTLKTRRRTRTKKKRLQMMYQLRRNEARRVVSTVTHLLEEPFEMKYSSARKLKRSRSTIAVQNSLKSFWRWEIFAMLNLRGKFVVQRDPGISQWQ
jgi:hypothetical protein